MKKKILIILVTLLIIGSVTIGIIYLLNDKKVAVLGFHGILPTDINTSNDNLIVNQDHFEDELKMLKKLGYKTLTLEEFECWKNKKCDIPHKSVLITFDDGYKNNLDYAFDLLKKYDMNAVVFVVGYYSESGSSTFLTFDEIEDSKNKYPNIEFASHSYNLHVHGDKSYDVVMDDSKKMSGHIQTTSFAYPFGDYTDEYIRGLKDSGFKLAFTFGPKREHRKADLKDDNYKIPRLNISKDMSLLKFYLRLILPM